MNWLTTRMCTSSVVGAAHANTCPSGGTLRRLYRRSKRTEAHTSGFSSQIHPQNRCISDINNTSHSNWLLQAWHLSIDSSFNRRHWNELLDRVYFFGILFSCCRRQLWTYLKIQRELDLGMAKLFIFLLFETHLVFWTHGLNTEGRIWVCQSTFFPLWALCISVTFKVFKLTGYWN